MYRQQYREESFGYIGALSNGGINAYGPGARHALANWREDKLGRYRLASIPVDTELRAPIFMTIELTLRCNLKCSHCYISAGEAREDELSTEEMLDLLDCIKDMGVFFLFLTGGEPTLRRGFATILNRAHDIGLDVNVLSNGSGINDRLLDSIPDTTTFVISVDGIDAHQVVRGNQTFAQVTRHIDRARVRGFPVITNTTVNKVNLPDLVALYDWAERERIVLVSLDLNNVGRADDNAALLFLDGGDVTRYLDFIDRKLDFDRILPDLYAETFGGPRPYSNPFYYSFAEDCIRATGYNYQGNYYLYVAADGEVYPDNFYAGETLFRSGNVRANSLAEIFSRARALVRGSNYGDFSCQGCPIHENGYFCDFRSAVMSMNLNGSTNECGAYGVMRELVLLREERMRNALTPKEAKRVRLYDNF